MLVLSASMSTLSSLVLTSSSSVTLDLVAQINKKMSDKAQLLTMRILLVMFIALSVIVALNPPTFIAQLMGYSWGALAGSFLAPFLYSLYWKKTTKASVWACFISGVGITITNMIFHYIASPINAGAFTMAIGLVIVPVVSLLSPKMNEDHIDKVFDCYNQKVTVEKRYSLEEDENETEDEEEEDIQNRLDA